MASRRTRIKGIANIPQRKRPALNNETSTKTDTPTSQPSTPSASTTPKLVVESSSDFEILKSPLSVASLENHPTGTTPKSVVAENSSDTENPLPPASPSKFNRNRLKSISRLSFKKPAGTSESEDENRKYSRIRNNSVCSVISLYSEPPTPSGDSQKDMPVGSPKKVFRTEQSRKLAEARREFYKKFGANNPDKQKLKMIDLIFYNPVSNPMSQKPVINEKISEKKSEEKLPSEEIEEVEIESDESMPVPQIKIGPTGEIVLDEQSLVVENTEIAKQKEQIKNSKVINGDFATGYGIYKRVPRARAWTQTETLRFYKALNLIGTDFTVMAQLFPKRNRRELKTKFKKEERINRGLIDKALKEPCQYNFLDLKRELDVEQEEEAFLQKLREDELKKSKEERETKKKRKLENSNKDVPSTVPPKKHSSNTKSLNIISVIEDSTDISSDSTESDDSADEDFEPFLKPTRSGRVPKFNRRINDIEFFLSNMWVILRSKHFGQYCISSVDSNSDRLVPGQVVAVPEDDDSQKNFKVFMVTPNRKLTLLDLESDVIERLIKENNCIRMQAEEAKTLSDDTIVTKEIEPSVESLII
ncbi:hypothetical protein ABEB36_006869 [Hypothenemus hampei]|uniref:Myb-like domain-containing protein n=1 Tax=Hypothenemus hampei TaxID=57062 RepID=A0ABD1EV27_HYPHA